jgi:alpha-D-ribose 1-methylphosphonate 5-triphosphate synthase subunit PhnG
MSVNRSSPAESDASAAGESAAQAGRRAIMSVCTAARREELSAVVAATAPALAAADLRPIESGLVMLRGRMGGDGRPFNLGEATVTRAAIVLADGRTGFAWQLGRDREKARAAAIIDALWQGEERDAIERALTPVRARIAEAAAGAARRTAATRVNFFTMVRGED